MNPTGAAAQVLAQITSGIDREGLGAYGVHVLVGDDAAEHHWRSDDRVNLYSVSKGVCALAAGIAVDEGILTLDTTIGETLGETLGDLPLGDGVAAVALRHLLTMTSGIDFTWFGHLPVPGAEPEARTPDTPPADLAQVMLGLPTSSAGTTFLYTDSSPYVAMRMLATRVGDVRDWLLPRMFEPLGIDNPQWHRCPLGYIMGGTGLELRTGELARIAQVLRDRGSWRGRTLVDPTWIDLMHDTTVKTGDSGPFQRYGLAVWDGPGDAWRLDGRFGQYVVVDQGRDAVVTITAHEEHRDHRLAEIAAEAMAAVG